MDFSLWAAGFPGLLWEIEHRRSRITLLNRWTLPALGEDTARLLKDVQFRRSVVLKSDHTLLGEFWEMMDSRQAAMVSFRLNANPNLAWLLQGWPAPDNPEKYFGLLKEAVLPATFITNGNAETCQLAIGHAQYPVLVLDLEQKEIVACNESAQELFLCTARGRDAFFLDDIAPGEMGKTLICACNHAMQEEIWAGTIMLRSGTGTVLGSKVRISPCTAEKNIARVALLNIPETYIQHADTNFEDSSLSLKAGLEKFLEYCPDADGIMFSDIQSTLGRVCVYGVGKLFADLKWGAPHAYEGTIAQDIERFGLNSLTVEDTMDSIKSIDWALFIPCGVRSYFAKPFFSGTRLHAVLIFAFASPASEPFAESHFQMLYEPFARLVARWRAAKTKP